MLPSTFLTPPRNSSDSMSI